MLSCCLSFAAAAVAQRPLDRALPQGVLRGYDPFMNLVLDDATDPASSDKKMGMVIIRGNSVVQFEILDPLRF